MVSKFIEEEETLNLAADIVRLLHTAECPLEKKYLVLDVVRLVLPKLVDSEEIK